MLHIHIQGCRSDVLVESIQVFEQRIGQLVAKCVSTEERWLPTAEAKELEEKWLFVLEAEAEMQRRYYAIANDSALD